MFNVAATYLAASMAVASVVTFFLYRTDKRRAAGGSLERIRERTLLVWSLIGGWPGGWLASRTYRHKTQKMSYRLKFAAVVVINIAAIISILAI